MVEQRNEQKVKSFCWSCGSPMVTDGICQKCQSEGEDSSLIISYIPPKEPPDFCGEQKTDSLYDRNVIMRPCCKCGKEWMCDRNTWIHGTCPHCLATGAYPNLKTDKAEKSYIEPIKLESLLSSSTNEVLISSMKIVPKVNQVYDFKNITLPKQFEPKPFVNPSIKPK